MKLHVAMLIAAGIFLYPIKSGAQILPPAPEKPSADENGVDVESAEFQYSQDLMSIGPKSNVGLDYTITLSGGAWRNSFSSTYLNTSGDFTPMTESISIGSLSENFVWGVPDNGMGSSIDGTGGFYVRRDGTTALFTHNLASSYDPVTGVTQLWSLVDQMTYPNGVVVTFHYRDDFTTGTQSTRLQSVTTNTGYQMKFTYAVNTITTPQSRSQWLFGITSVVAIDNAIEYCDPAADSCSLTGSWPTVQYTYPTGYTFAVTDPAGNTTRINSASPNFIVRTAESATNNITYLQSMAYDQCVGNSELKVTSATINGRTTNYSFSTTTAAETVVSTGPLSQQRTYVSGIFGAHSCRTGIKSVTDPIGRVTAFQNDGYNRLTRMTLPESNYVSFVLDDRGNATQSTAVPKPGSGAPTLAESRSYPPCTFSTQKVCNQPASYTDPRNNVTNYTYDANHGGVLSEMRPAPTSGAPRPLKVVGWTQKYAYIKNASGTLVQAASPIWVVASETECQTVAGSNSPVCDAAAQQTVTTYQYGADGAADNLLVAGVVVSSGSTSLRTCYGYDTLGRRISETSPNANLVTCP